MTEPDEGFLVTLTAEAEVIPGPGADEKDER